nr:hypothetical protein [Micromonospora sp. DSM 115978]
MSVRTFYAYFDGKDSLMVAVYETIMNKVVVPKLREQCELESDPVLRVKALIDAMFELTATPARVYRTLSVFHYKLAEIRPEDLGHALEPLRKLVMDLLTGVQSAGLLRDDIEISR